MTRALRSAAEGALSAQSRSTLARAHVAPRTAPHGIMPPWVRAFDSLRPRPVTSTSAARAPRSSTGCTRAGTAARSCSASRTPTSSAPRPTWSPAFSTGCAGSDSTGTKVRASADRDGPYFQSERLDRYREAAARLVAEGRAYHCYCSPERLREEREKAEQRGEAWQYDRACLALAAGTHRRARSGRRSARDSFQGARRPHRHSTMPCTGRIEFDSRQHRRLRLLRSDGTPDLSPFCCRRRCRYGDHACHPRRRSHLEHAEARAAVRGARRAGAAVCARAADPRRRQEAPEQAARRHLGRPSTGVRDTCRRRW